MNERTESTETVIDLREVFSLLLYRWWILILSALIVGAGTFGYTYFMVEPTYQASVLMYVNNSSISIGSTSVSISNSELTVAQKLVATYVVILQSRTMLNRVIEDAELDYNYAELRDMVSADAVNETEIFRVVVTSHNPVEAEKIANTIADILPDTIGGIVAGADVRIVDYAVVPSGRAAPNYTRNAAIGALIGVLVSGLIIVVAHLLDENIRNEDYLTQTYPDIPLLAVIPDMKASAKQRTGDPGASAYQRRAPEKPRTRPAPPPSGKAPAGQRPGASAAAKKPQSVKKLPPSAAPSPSADKTAERSAAQNRKKTAPPAAETAKKSQPPRKSAASSAKTDRTAGRADKKKSADAKEQNGADPKRQVIWDKKVRKWKEID